LPLQEKDFGNYWFNKIIERYSRDKNIVVEKHHKYPYVTLYYKEPMYKHYVYNFPIRVTPHNYRTDVFNARFDNEHHYNEMRGSVEGAKSGVSMAPGYAKIIHKIDKRLYLLRNNDEYRKQSLANAKAKAEKVS